MALEELEGRVGVVTGAASGIGLAVAEALAAEGMRLALADVEADRLAEEAGRLAAGGAEVLAVPTDVTDQNAVGALAHAVVARYGTVNLVMNNAGVVALGNSWELSLAEWHRIVDVNLWGVVHGLRAFVPLLLASGQPGHVVNTASKAAVLAVPRLGPYTVTKHAILGLSDCLRGELAALGAPIGVSVVMPGMVATRLNPVGTLPASAVAANVLDAIRCDRHYVFTDDHHDDEVEWRLGAILAARQQVV